jgi:cytochrome c oxidase assembly factor 1
MNSLKLIKRLPLNSIVKGSSNLRFLSTQFPLKNIPTPTDPISHEKIPFAIERELPEIPNNRNKYIAYAILGVLGWVGALGVLTNYQKQNTSITNSTLFICKYEPNSVEALGEEIDFQQSWPWISGYINHLKGKIDISYWVKGSKGNLN